ncbi:MAG: HNH endonuclease family protein [Alkalispirochaeta sp.]
MSLRATTLFSSLALALLFAGAPAVAQETADFTFGNTTYTIAVEPEYSEGGYDRDDWPHWSSVPGSCFTVRDKALAEESWVPVTTVEAYGGRCRVTEGLWRDPYTGREFTDSQDVDVDHVVPLAEAYESGGHAWSRGRRRAYANELADENHLMIVYDRENQAEKGKRDPAEYLPPNDEFLCDYLEAWAGIKARWDLSVDRAEAEAINHAMAWISQRN